MKRMKDFPQKIRSLGTPRTYAKGEFLFQTGEGATGFFYVRSERKERYG
jgi:hypothetical protein